MIQPGDFVRDRLSGLEGHVTAVTSYLYSCRRVCIQPPRDAEQSKMPDSYWFDEPQLEVLEAGAFVAEIPEVAGAPRRTGGGPDAPPRDDPRR